MMATDPIIVWFLLAWSSGKALPVQYGPFESENQCTEAMAVIRERRKEWNFGDKVGGVCVQGVAIPADR